MSQSPEATSTKDTPSYIAVFQQLADRIQEGEWSQGRLPTVRNLAVEYGVSAYTAQKAVQLLQHEGLIVTKDRSGCFVAPAEAAPSLPSVTGPWAYVLRVSPGADRLASEAVSRIGFDTVAADEDIQLISVTFELDATGDKGDPEAAVRAVVASGAKGVIFLPSRISDAALQQDETFLAGCRAAGLPVVLIDRNLRGQARALAYDLIASDHFEGGRICTEHLISIGRRRIACVIASPTSSHSDRLAGYLFVLGTAGIAGAGELAPLVLRVPDGMDQTTAYGWLADRILADRVDGVLCHQDYTAVGLTLELLLRGKTVPGDIAVVGCDDTAIGNSFTLGVTTYTYPSADIARWAVRLLVNRIAHPTDPPVKLTLPGQLIIRNSTVQKPQASKPRPRS